MASLGEQMTLLLDAFVDGIAPLARGARARRRLVATEDADGLVFHAVERGRAQPVGRTGDARIERLLRRYARGPVELRLSPDKLIRRQIQLPAAGREYLDPIIEHRMERLTPWRPERVLYGFAVAGEGTDGTLTVDLLATSDEIAAEAAAMLSAAGLTATAMGADDGAPEAPLRIDLYRGRRDVGRARLRRASAFALILLAAVLIPAAGAAVWLDTVTAERVATLEQRLATKRAVIQAATGTGDAENRDLRLIGAKRPETALVVLVDRLARAVPDDTHLRELEIDGARVRIAGLSRDAAALVGILEADATFSDVRFGAPVVRDDSGRDSFDLTMTADSLAAPATEASP